MDSHTENYNSISHRINDNFLKDLFKATMLQLNYNDNPIKYNSFAFSFRELIRHILYNLAPDSEIKKCTWYIPNSNSKNGITRIDRIQYAIRGGLSDSFIEKHLSINTHVITKQVINAVNALNKYTHIEEDVFQVSEIDGSSIVKNSLEALDNFYNVLETLRSNLIQSYDELLYKTIEELFLEETFTEIDILATHYMIDEINLEQIFIQDITSSQISIEIHGSISVEHQYGSDSDQRHGDGLIFNNSYPFIIYKKIDVQYPLSIEISPDEIQINHSNYFE